MPVRAAFALPLMLLAAPLSAQTTAPAAVAAAPAPAPAAEVVTNDTVIKLLGAGLGEAAVIAKIRSGNTSFDLSTDKLIELKSKGVPNAVIAAMLDPKPTVAAAPQELSLDSPDPLVRKFPGVYVLNAQPNDGKMTRLQPTSSSQARTSGLLGYAFTLGLAPMDIQAAINGPQARVRVASRRPTFYFYFDESVPRALQGAGNSLWASGVGGLTSSPDELSLVKFAEKKDRREARFGTVNIGGAKTGVMDKDRIPFQSDMIAPGLYKVTPNTDLGPGEYGFVQATGGTGALAGGGASAARVFDFGIAP
ncbi:hypothetical protein [Sandaracinobacteroides saxicola]|uniref:Uncharacterized protein n=1 Tax=Sandaracinobacteroides saxicola TaxID=2759707 RepID=A0A7G5IJF9_9SPHN|nr:hypothetical protein [Sandaracinobacteroides saxicola]QMW23501.1 hypothetical protein H3309_03090 [Sandaracinobacteroides saxicola]